MRIAIDIRPLMGGNISGVEKYIISMLRAIFEEDKKNEYILWYNAFKEVRLTEFSGNYPNVIIKRTRWPNKILNLSLSLLRWPKIDQLIGKGIDLIWIPDPRPAPISKKCRKVMTFHDLSFEEYKNSFNKKTRLWHKLLRPKKEACESNQLIAVSQFTKDRLIKLYHIEPQKITVIHEAVPVLLNHALADVNLKEKYGICEPYLLCLSTLEPRKNIHAVIRAFLSFKQKSGSQIQLVVAGKGRPDIFTSKALHMHKDIKRIGFVDEHDKPELYRGALAFIYPSFYEGFGLPVLEAMEYGTPVITSNTASLPEVVGAAALLINPHHHEQIEEVVERLINEPILREELIKKGHLRSAEFSWKKAAREFLKLIGSG